MKNAWIVDGVVKDTCVGNPQELFHTDVAAFYSVTVPDEVCAGWQLVNDVWTAPVEETPVPEVVAPQAPKVSPVEFKLLFTPQERIAIRQAKANDPVLQDFFEIVDDPRLTVVDLGLQSTVSGIIYLQSVGLLTQERVAEILRGELK